MKTSKKINGKLVGLSKLRVQLWLAAVLEGSRQANIEQMLNCLSRQKSECDPADFDPNKWYRYSAFSSSPLPELISKIDKMVPGTARIYRSGFERLPLFLVLGKDESACKRTVSSLLADAKLYQSGKSVTEKSHTLLQYMVGYQFGEAWRESHADLDQLIANPKNNAIAKSCKAKNLSSRTMLAIVALWILAQTSDDPKATDYTDYFLLGILGQPLSDKFGKLVADFILEMYEEAG
ncbi:hypothetical protein H8K47_17125 [Undibacterium sp. CY7W]|uniref:Uncharacterized protein n=1 Tax=Undibacterium rugosum TaxID=2762291 RepID=A0A923I3L7_9BURK|nr:hypothetical protein [Undibacterium rugosum]MBC3937081.1 hypothetical protein [Undibacterium rugosum]